MRKAASIFLLLIAISSLPKIIFAGEVGYGAEIDIAHRYAWRGLVYDEGVLAQPSIWLSFGSLNISNWNNIVVYDLESESYTSDMNEMDFYLSYSVSGEGFSVEPNFLYYYYPGSPGDSTGELGVAASWESGGFSIYADGAVDVDYFAGAYYADIGGAYGVSPVDRLRIDIDLSVGYSSADYSEAYYGVYADAINAGVAKLSLTGNLTDTIYIRPHFAFHHLIDQRLRDVLDDYTYNLGVAIGVDY